MPRIREVANTPSHRFRHSAYLFVKMRKKKAAPRGAAFGHSRSRIGNLRRFSEISLDYITEKTLDAALCGFDDKTVLIDDLRPLELNDELAERVDEAIPLESLDRVDEDIK